MAWIPLESNPEVLNSWMYKLGVKRTWKFVDVVDLESEGLSFLGGPVIAIVLLLPCGPKYEEFSKNKMSMVRKLAAGDHKDVSSLRKYVVSDKVFHMMQLISNSCGDIAMIHAIANNLDKDILGEGQLKDFIEKALPLSAEKRGELFAATEGLANVHSTAAIEGQTAAPTGESSVNYHFLALVHVDGCIYELDGRKECAINEGPSGASSFVFDAARVCRGYIEHDPDNLNFTVLALVPNDDADELPPPPPQQQQDVAAAGDVVCQRPTASAAAEQVEAPAAAAQEPQEQE